MLAPKKQKHRKVFRGRSDASGISYRGCKISFGSFGLKATTTAEVTSRQIEAARRVLTRFTKKGGKIWITIFPHKPITKKAAEVPMGSGKGAPDHFVAQVKPGRIIFEMDGIDEKSAREAIKLAGYKLPVKSKFVNIDETK